TEISPMSDNSSRPASPSKRALAQLVQARRGVNFHACFHGDSHDALPVRFPQPHGAAERDKECGHEHGRNGEIRLRACRPCCIHLLQHRLAWNRSSGPRGPGRRSMSAALPLLQDPHPRTNAMYQEYNFASVLAASARAAWQIEDVLPEGAALDFNRPFLPESLACTAAAEGLSAEEERILNQIRGHEYLVLFGLVEE